MAEAGVGPEVTLSRHEAVLQLPLAIDVVSVSHIVDVNGNSAKSNAEQRVAFPTLYDSYGASYLQLSGEEGVSSPQIGSTYTGNIEEVKVEMLELADQEPLPMFSRIVTLEAAKASDDSIIETDSITRSTDLRHLLSMALGAAGGSAITVGIVEAVSKTKDGGRNSFISFGAAAIIALVSFPVSENNRRSLRSGMGRLRRLSRNEGELRFMSKLVAANIREQEALNAPVSEESNAGDTEPARNDSGGTSA
jgi:hypothetical protein